jgi:predicted SAM-dependent methyltransferase
MKKIYAQYGCGHSAPEEWINFDVSPTLRIQKIPLIGKLSKNQLNTTFPSNVLYGDIIKGLPVEDNSCDGLYCSHTLEHLSLTDFRIALKNSYKILKKGGIFRCIVPDLEFAARLYINELERGNNTASIDFVGRNTLLGIVDRPRGLKNFMTSFFGNSHHLWMWDYQSLSKELKDCGFTEIRRANFNDCEDEYFAYVESVGRFENAVAIECKK